MSPWEVASTDVKVNGSSVDMSPNDGETLSDFVKRVCKTHNIRTVDVMVDGEEVSQGDYRTSQPARNFSEISVSRHTTVGQY